MRTLPRYAREKIAVGRNSVNSALDNPRRRMSDKCRFFRVTSRLDMGWGEETIEVEEHDGQLLCGETILSHWQIGTQEGKVMWFGTPEGIAAFMESFGTD